MPSEIYFPLLRIESNQLNVQLSANQCIFVLLPLDHLLLDSAPNLGPLISRWEIKKFEYCWYKSVRILEVLKLLFQQLLNLSSSKRDMSGPILGDLSNNKWSGVTDELFLNAICQILLWIKFVINQRQILSSRIGWKYGACLMIERNFLYPPIYLWDFFFFCIYSYCTELYMLAFSFVSSS